MCLRYQVQWGRLVPRLCAPRAGVALACFRLSFPVGCKPSYHTNGRKVNTELTPGIPDWTHGPGAYQTHGTSQGLRKWPGATLDRSPRPG